jgi:hypothetical protein
MSNPDGRIVRHSRLRLSLKKQSNGARYLRADWELAKQRKELQQINPLE